MTFESELLEAFEAPIAAGSIKVYSSSEDFFRELSNCFSLTGSKIDWDEVPNSVVDINENINDLTLLIEFFESIYIKEKLSGNVVCINDGPIDCALVLPIEIARKYLKNILEFPGHHYFVSEDYLWCMSFTMEGDMAFGYSRLKKQA